MRVHRAVDMMEKKAKGSLRFPKSQKLHSPMEGAVGQLVPSRFTGNWGRRISYRVAYTWNRGGRLKELRIRHLARKFLYLWMKKVFGRILFSTARCYYDRRILRKAFGEWKEEWWLACREWKLTIRADCHYRYFLYNLIFQAWGCYMLQQREKKKKHCVAEAHVAKRRTLWSWQHWQSYVLLRRMKHRMHLEAFRFREQSILRLSWRLWRKRWCANQASYEMDARALQHWAQNLECWAWLQWKGLYTCIQHEKEKAVMAMKHCHHKETRRAIKSWCAYVQLRREKKRQDELALQHRQSCALLQHFSLWQLTWERKRQLHIHQERIVQLAARVTLRRVFTRWKRYVALCAEATKHHEVAEHHYRLRLLCRGLCALRKNVVDASLKRMRRNLAYRQHQVTLLHRIWNGWKSRLEQKEEDRDQSLTLAAHSHYSLVLLHKSLQTWLHRANWERGRKLQCAKADQHYKEVLLPIAFQAWKQFKDHQHWWKETKRVALGFHRDVWTRRWFERWQRRTQQQQETCMAEKMAALHSEQRLRARFWCFWHRRTVARREEQEGASLAKEHHSRKLLQATFCLWKEGVQEIKEERTKEAEALRFHSAQLLRQSWSQWQQYLRHRSEKWKKLVKADLHYQRALLGRVLSAWKTYQSDVQHLLFQVAQKEREHHRTQLRQVLCAWKANATQFKHEAKAAALADQHCRRAALSKVLLQWRDVAMLCAYRRQQGAAAVEDAKKRLHPAKLQAVFLRWKESSIRSSRQRGLLALATRHHERQLLNKCVARWKQHHLQCIRKMLLQRRGEPLLAQRLVSTAFSLWKIQLAHRQWEQQETVRALWHWSLTLQGKALDAWAGFVLERRRKKGRIERAVEAYRAGLLQEGVTRILRFMAGMKQFRGQLQAQQQLKVAHHRYQSVYRCAMLWKQKALCRQPGQLPPGAPLKKRVTFQLLPPGASAKGALGGVASLCGMPRPAPGDDLPLFQAAGDSLWTELQTARQRRLPPRRPDFLRQSLERMEPPGPFSTGMGSLAGPWLQTAPAATTLSSVEREPSSRPSLPLPTSAPLPCKLPQPHSVACPKPVLLLPPSSFRPRQRNGLERATDQPLSLPSGHHSTDPPAAASAKKRKAELLLPEDFTRREGSPPLGGRAGWQGKHMRSSPKEAEVHSQLEAELQHIGQKMQLYHSNQQELKSLQRQERILLKWLEMSSGAEEQADVQQVREELEQLKVQSGSLTKRLGEERRQMQAYITRVQEIRAALSA
ncbi:protein SFI1 homolog isoform X3 [Hemicordylus capensis]|nr:protein SFI1 homolog isoform X3 [Hemicordylus capensis]XP_053135515.1 protein SFI1 homolog isoform X3 [Hemicordylus capensis]XP_053135516.1 protein SFI1 homolog isoform X3 [Hemicordylus capensis]XP_053135517.1 protein SFI1 homolog isoform X3 [Hemicordylus capensis]